MPPSAAADSGELQSAGRRDMARSFGMRSKACIDWLAASRSAITPGRRGLEWTSSGPGHVGVARAPSG
jgi:hypothetical protein